MVLLPTDPSTIDEWRAAMVEVLDAPVARPHLAILVDRRSVETVTTIFVDQMAAFFTARPKAFAGSRTAVLVSDDAGFGMGRMTELKSSLENPTAAIRVFRNYHAAVLWLTGG